VVLFALAVGLAFNAWLFNPQQWPLIGVDGKQFYAVAQVSARGEDPYATPILYAEQDRLFNPPGRPAGYAHTAYGYPPLFTAVLRAGAGLDPVAFYVVAAVLMLGVAVAGLELTLGALGVRRRWSARLMFAASPPLALCIFLANPSPVLLLGSAAALALSWSGRDFLAGVALALVMLKLPVGAPVAVALLLTAPRVPPARLLGAWLRAAGGLVLGIAALMLLQLLVVGGGGPAQWVAGLGDDMFQQRDDQDAADDAQHGADPERQHVAVRESHRRNDAVADQTRSVPESQCRQGRKSEGTADLLHRALDSGRQ